MIQRVDAMAGDGGMPEPRPKNRRTIILIACVAMAAVMFLGSALLYIYIYGGTGILTWPKCTITVRDDSPGFTFEISDVTLDATWSDVGIRLETFPYDNNHWYYWDWHPTREGLRQDPGGAITQSLANSGGYCNITDTTGNGYVDSGDFFTLAVDDPFPGVDHGYQVGFIYEPNSETMGVCQFQTGDNESRGQIPALIITVAAVLAIVAGLILYLRKGRRRIA